MSSGGDGNYLNSFKGKGNFFENLALDIANVGVQTVTAGTVGVDRNGVKAGETTKGLKEVTGARAAEKANEFARKQFEEQKSAAEADRLEAQKQQGRDQMVQSQKAGAARNATKNSVNKGTAIGGSNLGDQQDFLGL